MEQTGTNSSLDGAQLASIAEQTAYSAHQAIDQLSGVTRPAISRATSRAHHLVDSISGTTSRVAQRLEKTACRLKNTEQRLVGVSSNYVREHPLASAGIALAAGFLVSQLVGSRKPPGHDKEAETAESSGTPAREGS
ncbi:MAG: DUF883 C-terminal domain-containing protein [Burkholderiaceae bacterium]|nr:DUF883 C-terminal domain-containing protein [Burkholderiaceae bacterium]